MTENGFFDVLRAQGRAAEIPEEKDLYGWLVGDWDLEIEFYGIDVSQYGWKGEAHFAWVLDGYAIQDTWTLPRWGAEKDPHKVKNSTGTTLRVWSPQQDAWLITWINPVSGARDELVGRLAGEDLVQLGHHADGTIIRVVSQSHQRVVPLVRRGAGGGRKDVEIGSGVPGEKKAVIEFGMRNYNLRMRNDNQVGADPASLTS